MSYVAPGLNMFEEASRVRSASGCSSELAAEADNAHALQVNSPDGVSSANSNAALQLGATTNDATN